MNIHLLIYQILMSASLLIGLFTIFFVLFKAKNGEVKVTFILLLILAIIFESSQLIGVSISDSVLSQKILLLKIVTFVLPVMSTHCVLASIGKQKEYRKLLVTMYAVTIGTVIFFIIKPFYFFEISVPKMYFPNYYEAGKYCYSLVVVFLSVVLISAYLIKKIYPTANAIDKNRIKYFVWGWILGYFFGFLDYPLIYNLHIVDPLWGCLSMPSLALMFAYTAVQYELMDIKLVAKKASIYGLVSAIICALLIFVNYLNNIIIQTYPSFPNWISSIVLAIVLTVVVFVIWNKMKEEDVLKYEFVNTIIHKFRTPLTAIIWSSESLTPENIKEGTNKINKSAKSLVDMTNLLVNLSTAEDDTFQDNLIKIDLNNFIKGLVTEYTGETKEKEITYSEMKCFSPYILADERKIKFVFQSLIDNSIKYTNENGKINIEIINPSQKNIIIKISDNGIGIAKDKIKLIFTKFFRTDASKKIDTEGMGIGLYLSKKIIERHHGKMWVESDGCEKGSSFYVSLPVYQK